MFTVLFGTRNMVWFEELEIFQLPQQGLILEPRVSTTVAYHIIAVLSNHSITCVKGLSKICSVLEVVLP